MLPRPPRSPLFPYTTLFRSGPRRKLVAWHGVRGVVGIARIALKNQDVVDPQTKVVLGAESCNRDLCILIDTDEAFVERGFAAIRVGRDRSKLRIVGMAILVFA